MKVQDNGLKVCSKCKKEKFPTQFYKDRKTSDGLAECCKDCSSINKHKRTSATRKKDKARYANNRKSISDYIAEKTEDGILMANYNIGILKAVNRVDDETDVDSIKGVICVYKGVPVTAEAVQKSNQWLMDNWKGKPGQRMQEPERDDRTEDQKMDELRYTIKELGYKLVTIDEK